VGLAVLAVVGLLALAILVSVPWLPSGGQSVSAAVRNWFARAPRAALLVTTDSDCDWQFDGKPRGRLRANESSTLATGFGQHLLEATTSDGKDELRVVAELHKTEQQVAAIEWGPIRQARLDREAEERRGEELRKAAAEALRRKREWESRSWYGPTSGLTWAYEDIGRGLDYLGAEEYCTGFRGGGYADWRLPTLFELQSVFGATRDPSVRGPFRVGGSLWIDMWHGAPLYSYPRAYDPPQEAEREGPAGTQGTIVRVSPDTKLQALCVRGPGSR
jgi:hypothetical protein